MKQALIQQGVDRERTAILDGLIIYQEIWFQFFSVDSSFHILLILTTLLIYDYFEILEEITDSKIYVNIEN